MPVILYFFYFFHNCSYQHLIFLTKTLAYFRLAHPSLAQLYSLVGVLSQLFDLAMVVRLQSDKGVVFFTDYEFKRVPLIQVTR